MKKSSSITPSVTCALTCALIYELVTGMVWAGSMQEAELSNLLVQDCGSCHGLTMRGGLGPALLPETLAGKPDELLVATILEGRPGTAMPPWKELLDHDDAAWMVRRLKGGLKGDLKRGLQ